MRLEDLDARRPFCVGDRLQRHAVEVRVRRRDDADRSVDDGLDRPLVEERLDERERRSDDGEPPEDERPVERRRRAQLPLERELRRGRGMQPARAAALRDRCPRGRGRGASASAPTAGRGRARPAESRHVRNAARPRRVGASVVRSGPASLAAVPRSSTRPASRSCAERAIHERSRAGVDATDLAVGRQLARDRPPVTRLARRGGRARPTRAATDGYGQVGSSSSQQITTRVVVCTSRWDVAPYCSSPPRSPSSWQRVGADGVHATHDLRRVVADRRPRQVRSRAAVQLRRLEHARDADPERRAGRSLRLGRTAQRAAPLQSRGWSRSRSRSRRTASRSSCRGRIRPGSRSVYDLKRKPVKLVVAGAAVPVGAYTRTVLRKTGPLLRSRQGREPGDGRARGHEQGRARAGRRRLRLRDRRARSGGSGHRHPHPGVGAAARAVRDRRRLQLVEEGGGARVDQDDSCRRAARRR